MDPRRRLRLFSGLFFARPGIIHGQHVAAAKLNCLRLLSELQKPELDFKRLEALIRGDVRSDLQVAALCELRAVRPARRNPIDRARVEIIGSDDIRRWVALATLPMLATDKPGELATLAIVRARFCERLIQLAGMSRQNEAFPHGHVLAIGRLDRPAARYCAAAVRLGAGDYGSSAGDGAGGRRSVESLSSTRRYEQGDWDEVEALARGCGFPGSAAGDAYVEAALWAQQMQQAVSG